MSVNYALFFDNDMTYVNQFLPYCDKIMPFHVGGIHHPGGGFPIIGWNEPAMKQFVNSLSISGKNFAKVIQRITGGYAPNDNGDVYDPSSGITEEHYYTILNALIQLSAREGGSSQIAAIFDFDRTLSVMEGFIGANSPPIEPHSGMQGYIDFLIDNNFSYDINDNPVQITAYGIIEYILGGPYRKRLIQRLIGDIAGMGHPIIILTNNGVGINNPEFLKDFFPGYQNYIEVICSRNYNYNKPAALHAAGARYDRLFTNPAPAGNQFYVKLHRSHIRDSVTLKFPSAGAQEEVAVSHLFPPYEAFQNMSAGKDGFVALGVLAVLGAILMVSVKRR